MKYFPYIFFFIFTISCEKEELPISPHQTGDVLVQQIEMLQDYRYQVFYNLENNEIISENLKTDWDLGFENTPNGFHIVLNSSTYSGLSYIENQQFDDVISSNNLVWSWDNPNGILDSTAFGDYRLLSGFFVIDRGFDFQGSQRGFKKLKIDSVNSQFYMITYSNLDNSELNTFQIYKDNFYRYSCFSFSDDTIIDIEPPLTEWDLVFTQYTHLFSDTIQPSYLVTGVLSNNLNIAIDTNNNFNDITYEMIGDYYFKNNNDMVGYNWKEYDLNAGEYTVFSNINYIIQNNNNKYYKLHFIDFYNNLGEKGYPKFEIQEL